MLNVKRAYGIQFFMHFHLIGGVLVPFFMEWGGISYFEVTVLQSVFVITSAMAEIPTGGIADKWGRRVSIIYACFLSIVGVMCYASAPNFWIFLLGEVILAFSLALLSGSHGAFVADSFKNPIEQSKAFSRFKNIGVVGMMLTAPLGGLIADKMGLEWTMRLWVIPLTIAFLISLKLEEPSNGNNRMTYLETLRVGIGYFHKNKRLKYLALNGVLFNMLSFILIWLYQLILKDLGVDNKMEYGVIHSLLCFSQVVMNWRFGKITKNKSPAMFTSTIIPGLGFLFLGLNFFLSGPLIIPAIIVISIISGFGLTRPVMIEAHIQRDLENETRATVISVITMYRRIGMGILYPFLGISVEWSLRWTLIIIGGLTLILSFLLRIKHSDL